MRFWKSIRLLVTFTPLILSGCAVALVGAGAAAGVGGAMYVMGKLEKTFDGDVAQIHAATLAGLEDLKMPIQDEGADAATGVVKSSFADGAKVQIHLEAVTPTTTKISIRVGTFGDEKRSQIILEAIQKHLPPGENE